MPRFSVITPAFNAAAFLPSALADLAAQALTDWELVIAEDGTDDGTAGIARTFAAGRPQGVTYHRLPENRGVSAARNAAISLARGDAIAFLDADDRWSPDHLATAAAALDRGATFILAGFDILQGGSRRPGPAPGPAALADPVPALLTSNFIQTSSAITLSRAAWADAGPFDPALRVGEDLDVWLRALARGHRLTHSGATTVTYVKHAASAMADPLRVAHHQVRFLEKQLRSGILPAPIVRTRLLEARLSRARLLRTLDPAAARAEARAAWQLAPLSPRAAGWFLATHLAPRRNPACAR